MEEILRTKYLDTKQSIYRSKRFKIKIEIDDENDPFLVSIKHNFESLIKARDLIINRFEDLKNDKEAEYLALELFNYNNEQIKKLLNL